MGWGEDREILDWIEDSVEVQAPFWTMVHSPAEGVSFGGFMLTPEFEEWCRDNLSGYWQVGYGTIDCACGDDAVLLRLHMGGG